MSDPRARQPDLFSALSDVAADLADLFQKELRLAKAEIAAKLSLTAQGGAWMIAAGVCAVLVLLLLTAAAVFAIAAQGFALYWACLIVAAAHTVLAGIFYGLARRILGGDLVPNRTLQQVTEDVRVAKEQLT
jgi:uncharacterized membrane protein YgcG